MRRVMTLAVLLLVVDDAAGEIDECCGFAFSYDNEKPSRYDCVSVDEPADPHTWGDNVVCGPKGSGLRWSYAGAIRGMRCTAIAEAAEPAEHAWADNFLCVPSDSEWELAWSMAGPIENQGYHCVAWTEPADPHTWNDNFLCYRRRQLVTTVTRSWPIKGGTATTDHPTIGRLVTRSGACTATLIAPRIAVTAAHCVDYKSQTTSGNYGTLTFTSGRRRSVVQVRAYGSSVGKSDVALLLLDASCSSTPTPLSLGQAFPGAGTDIRIFGYGCTAASSACGGGTGGGGKQVITGKLGETSALCPGDSGGPVLVGDALVGINSGHDCWTYADIFADPTTLRSQVQNFRQTFPCGGSTANECPDGERMCHLLERSECMSPATCRRLQRAEDGRRER